MLQTPTPARDPLLRIEGLRVLFPGDGYDLEAVRRVDLAVGRGETLCVVGESGSGKSVTARAVLRLIDEPGRIAAGRVLVSLDGGTVDTAAIHPQSDVMRRIRGGVISMIFQEPMTSLSPVHTVGDQIGEMLMLHEGLTRRQARERTIELLDQVGIPGARDRVDAYTFQLSGGLRQRAMIAMALSCRPSLLIADEPTTALDVTTQAQILELLEQLRDEIGMAMLFITHDLSVVAEIADRVAVMYLGEIVEEADVFSLFEDPKHPYTRALLASIPHVERRAARARLRPIEGTVPSPLARPEGCPFHTRCEAFMPGLCDRVHPARTEPGASRGVRCHLYPGSTAPDPARAA